MPQCEKKKGDQVEKMEFRRKLIWSYRPLIKVGPKFKRVSFSTNPNLDFDPSLSPSKLGLRNFCTLDIRILIAAEANEENTFQ